MMSWDVFLEILYILFSLIVELYIIVFVEIKYKILIVFFTKISASYHRINRNVTQR